MARAKPWAFAFGVGALIGCCAAAELSDDFADNLLTDLAPILALFGEPVTKQFLSQSTGWSDVVILAMAPLGIVTIVVSAIRVGGPSWLKAAIGRARENLAVAEVDLMSSTSGEVCELWNGHEIVRCMGSAPLREFVCISPVERSQSTGKSADEEHLPKESFISDPEPGQSPSSWYPFVYRDARQIVTRERRPGAPNITLNLHKQTRQEVYAAAVLGVSLQAGILLYAGFATYYPKLRYPKEEDDPVASYAYPCMATGTVALVLGLMLCGHVVESSTEEKTTRTREGFEARHIWLQRKATVGDQTFGSCAVFPSDPQVTMVTSQRCSTYEPTLLDRLILGIPVLLVRFFHRSKGGKQSQQHSALLETKATIGTLVSTVGFVLQFVGLRGVHWSVSIFQLGAVLTMTLVRVYIRRVHSRPPLFLPLPPGFELDWFAMSLMERDAAPWLRHVKEAESDAETEKSEDTCTLCGSGWRVVIDRAPYSILDWNLDGKPVTSPSTPAHNALMIRRQLGELAGWRSLVHAEAGVLKRAMEVTMGALASRHRGNKLTWSVETAFKGMQSHVVQFSIVNINGEWAADLAELEAALSLWLYSADQEHRSHQSKADRGEDEENWFDTEDPLRCFSLRSLGKNTRQLRRDLAWWTPRNMGNFMRVWPEGREPRSEDDAMDLRMHRARAVGPSLLVPGDTGRECGQPLHVDVHRGPIDLRDFYSKADEETVIATDGFCSVKTLYAQELFSAFMWAVAKSMSGPIAGGADVQVSEVSVDSQLEAMTLSNKVLSTLVNSIQGTGLGHLDTIYSLVLPPLSVEGKLPAVHQVVELARKEALPYELRGKLVEAGRVYLRLSRILETFSEDDEVAVKAAAVLVHHRRQVERELRDWERHVSTQDGLGFSMLERLKEALDRRQGSIYSGLEELYECRWQDRPDPRGQDATEELQVSHPQADRDLRPNLGFTSMHMLARRRDRRRSHFWPSSSPVHDTDVFGRTPVHYAATLPDSDMLYKLDYLRALRAPVDATDIGGRTPLHYACDQTGPDVGDMSVAVRRLLKAGADANAQARDGTRPLHCAAESGARDTLMALVEAGAQADVLDATGKSPLMLAALGGHEDAVEYLRPFSNTVVKDVHGRGVLHMAALSGSLRIAEVFAADAFYSQDRNGHTPLDMAALAGHVDMVRFLMEHFDTREEFTSPKGSLTPLHSAISRGQEDVVRVLIRDLGVDRDTPDGSDLLPVHYAARAGHESILRLLISEFDAYTEARDMVGGTPLHEAVRVGHGLSLIKTMIEDLGCDAHTRTMSGVTLLHEACSHDGENALEVIRYLVQEHDLDVNSRDDDEMTPLHHAGRKGRHQTMMLLMDLGAEPNARTVDGQTALHLSSWSLTESLMATLVSEYKMDDEARDAMGRTPRMMMNSQNRLAPPSFIDEPASHVEN